MRLRELENGAEIGITAYMNGVTAEFKSEVVKPYSKEDFDILKDITEGHDFTVINLVTLDEKRINFIVEGIKYRVTGCKEGFSYYWRNPAIVVATLPTLGNVHVVIANSEGIQFNRREYFRLWLGIHGTVSYGEYGVPYDIVVKDVSATGIGILAESFHSINIGDSIEVQFKDERMHTSKREYVSTLYTVEAEVVRIVPRDERHNIIGCIITSNTKEIEQLIYRKQMERARTGGRKALYTKKKDSEL